MGPWGLAWSSPLPPPSSRAARVALSLVSTMDRAAAAFPGGACPCFPSPGVPALARPWESSCSDLSLCPDLGARALPWAEGRDQQGWQESSEAAQGCPAPRSLVARGQGLSLQGADGAAPLRDRVSVCPRTALTPGREWGEAEREGARAAALAGVTAARHARTSCLRAETPREVQLAFWLSVWIPVVLDPVCPDL